MAGWAVISQPKGGYLPKAGRTARLSVSMRLKADFWRAS